MRIDTMQANEFFDIDFKTRLGSYEAGNYLIGVVDNQNDVAEKDEYNNTVYHVIPSSNTVYQSIPRSGHTWKIKHYTR